MMIVLSWHMRMSLFLNVHMSYARCLAYPNKGFYQQKMLPSRMCMFSVEYVIPTACRVLHGQCGETQATSFDHSVIFLQWREQMECFFLVTS